MSTLNSSWIERNRFFLIDRVLDWAVLKIYEERCQKVIGVAFIVAMLLLGMYLMFK